MSTYATSVWSWWLRTSNKADETSRNMLTILVPMFIVIWFVFFNKKQNKRNPPLPPGPRGLPLVGYLPFLGSNLHHSFKELASLYGPIFKVKLGAKQCVVLTSPSLVKEVVRDHDVIFANRGEPTVASRSVLFGTMDIGFTDYGSEWRKMRKVFVSEMMSNARLDANHHLRKQQLRKMMYGTYKKANQIVNVGEIVFITICSSVMNMIWGDTMKGKESSFINADFRAVITEIVELLGRPNISDFFPWLARYDLQGIERRMKEISRRCGKIFDSAIKQHNTEEINYAATDFLGSLLQYNKLKDRATSLTLPQVKNILMDVVVGGTDTTSTLTEWAMAEVLQQPIVLRKIQDELTEIVGLNTSVEEVHLPKLKYLNAVVKETLRLHPSLPLLIPHCPSEPSTIGGYSIPKGVRIFLNVYAIHRDPKFWEDPLVFRPERFLNESDVEKMDYSGKYFQYLPFGSGRRICAGIPLAERMSVLILASLLHGFQWELPSDTVEVDFSEKFGIVVKKLNPLIAIPSPRLSNLELYSYQD